MFFHEAFHEIIIILIQPKIHFQKFNPARVCGESFFEKFFPALSISLERCSVVKRAVQTRVKNVLKFFKSLIQAVS